MFEQPETAFMIVCQYYLGLTRRYFILCVHLALLQMKHYRNINVALCIAQSLRDLVADSLTEETFLLYKTFAAAGENDFFIQ